MSLTTVELCCGTAAVTICALAGRHLDALTGYMGGKQQWDEDLCVSAFGGERPDHAVLVDAGPWGDAWSTLATRHGPEGVEHWLRGWHEIGTLPDLWPAMVRLPPPSDPHKRAAQFLCLQARSASCIPIWWDGSAWVSPTGSRVETDGQRQARKELARAFSRIKGGSGLLRIGTLAARVHALRRLPLDRVTVVHGRVQDVPPIPGSRVFFDPPYLGCPRYAEVFPRAEVLTTMKAWAAVADRVTVSEAEGLDLPGWQRHRLTDREWVTTWRAPAPRAQMPLWEVA